MFGSVHSGLQALSLEFVMVFGVGAVSVGIASLSLHALVRIFNNAHNVMSPARPYHGHQSVNRIYHASNMAGDHDQCLEGRDDQG